MQAVCPRRGIRPPAGVWAAGTLAVCLAAGPLGAQSAPSDSARVTGTVLDEHTDEPLSDATLLLFDRETGVPVALVESGPAGAFAFPPVAPGRYALRIRRLGYREMVEEVEVSAGSVLVTATLSPDAVSLEPVEVTVEGARSVALREFERRRSMGLGSFITREEIEESSPLEVTELFQGTPGVRIIRDAQGDGHLVLRGRCRPNVYIDGIATDATLSLDLSLRPDDVEGIEVYTTDSAPAQYARNACGVVLLWTRVPQRVRGEGSWWKPLAVVGGLLATLIIVR